jgi:hypothetical protein
MRNSTHRTLGVMLVLVVGNLASVAWAANPYSAPSTTDVYLRGHAEIGKSQAAIVAAQASVITSSASTNAAMAKAIEDLQKVRTITLENDLKAVKAFYDRRKLYADYQAQHAAPRADKDEFGRRSKSSTERASAYQVDPVRGRIYWPSALKRDEFSDARAQMDDLFAHRRARQAGLGSNFCRQVKDLAGDMRDQLKGMMEDLSPPEYLAARKFLDTLAFEAQMPAQVEGVAAK